MDKTTDFFDNVENQKKYGFTVEYRNGIQCIFYDGDFDVLNEAAYGPAIKSWSRLLDEGPTHFARLMKLAMTESGQLMAQVQGEDALVSVVARILDDESTEPNFAICRESNGEILSRFSLIDPEYYPDEDSCRYLLNLRSLTTLNEYIQDNHTRLLNEWNGMYPDALTEPYLPIPNYRYLCSEAYKAQKKRNRAENQTCEDGDMTIDELQEQLLNDIHEIYSAGDVDDIEESDGTTGDMTPEELREYLKNEIHKIYEEGRENEESDNQ